MTTPPITPPEDTTTTTGPAMEESPRVRAFNAMDHYNAAAESLQNISDHYDDDDFGPQDAMFLLQIAMTHGMLGQLKLDIDRGRAAGK